MFGWVLEKLNTLVTLNAPIVELFYNSVYPSETLLNSLYQNMPANMDSEVNTQNQIKNQASYAKYIDKGLNLLDKKNTENSFRGRCRSWTSN